MTYEAADSIIDAADPLQALVDKPFIMYVGRPTPHKNLEQAHSSVWIYSSTAPRFSAGFSR